jgi:hypothetical protein
MPDCYGTNPAIMVECSHEYSNISGAYAMKHGGKRENAGRPKGSTGISPELRDKFKEHTDDAIQALVDVANDPQHPDRLKAASLILDRAHGTAGAHNPAEGIIQRFMDGEISAIQAGLLLESAGVKVPELMQRYFDNEVKIRLHKEGEVFNFELNAKPEPLPTA